MKICPTCRRTYEDDGLNFCLEDGTVLNLSGIDPAAPTIVMNQPRPTSPQPASMPTSWDAQNAGQYSMQPKKKSSKTWVWVLGILGLLVLVCGGGAVGFFIYLASLTNADVTANAARTIRTPSPSRSANAINSNSSPAPWTEPGNVEQVDLAKYVREMNDYGTTEFKDGEFLVSSKGKGYYFVVVTPDDYKTDDARTRVIVRNPDAKDSDLGYGLVFHSDTTPLEKDYAFLIDSVRKRFRVVRHEPGDEVTVTAWTNSKSIHEGSAENTLEARDKGEKIELYINGQLATTITNKQGPTGGVPGLYAGDGAKVGFKKLEIVK